MKGQFLWTKLKSVTVEPVLFLYMMVIFLESSALKELISVKSCLKIIDPENINDCRNKTIFTDDIKQEKTYWVRYNDSCLYLFTFLSSFFVASWSDKFGRKFPMLIPPIGTMIAASINCILSIYMYSHVGYLLISSTISGLTFGTVGIIAATFGFIADISDESSRTKRLVILEAMIYIGGTLGTYIVGEILRVDYNSKLNGFSIVFIVEMCIAIFTTFYIVFRIPYHSNYNTELSNISCENLFKLDHIKHSVKAVFRCREAGKRKIVLLLSFALFLIYFGLTVQFTLAYYFLQDALQWNIKKYSTFNSIQFAVQGTTLILGLPIFFHFLKVPDHIIAVIGLLSKITAYIVFGLSSSDAMVYSCIICYMFSLYPVPTIKSIISKIVDADEKGRIFAFTSMLQNLCFLLGSFTLTTIYKSTITIFPGLCFVIAASLETVALSIVLYLYFTRGETVTVYEIMENEDGSTEESCDIVRTSGSVN